MNDKNVKDHTGRGTIIFCILLMGLGLMVYLGILKPFALFIPFIGVGVILLIDFVLWLLKRGKY